MVTQLRLQIPQGLLEYALILILGKHVWSPILSNQKQCLPMLQRILHDTIWLCHSEADKGPLEADVGRSEAWKETSWMGNCVRTLSYLQHVWNELLGRLGAHARPQHGLDTCTALVPTKVNEVTVKVRHENEELAGRSNLRRAP